MQMLSKMDTMQRKTDGSVSPSPAASDEIIAMHESDEEHDSPTNKSADALDLYDMDWSGVAAQHDQNNNNNNVEAEVKTIRGGIAEPLVYDMEEPSASASPGSSSRSPGNKKK